MSGRDRPIERGRVVPSPSAAPSAWPPPRAPDRRPPAEPARVGLRLVVLTLLLGVAGVVGALLPAMAGQKVGDPQSTVFRVGLPLGLVGGATAVALGLIGLVRAGATSSTGTAVALGFGVCVGAMALFLSAALAFSG